MYRKPTFLLLKFLFIIMLYPLAGNGQSYKAYDLNDYLATHQISKSKSTSDELSKLIFEVNPSIYIVNGEMKQYGKENPTVLNINFKDWQILTTNSPNYKSIKLLKIKHDNSLSNKTYDLSQLKAFKELKYIYIQCISKCSKAALEQSFINVNDIVIVYLTTITE